MTYDPHLDPIVRTWDTRTLEDVREALQSIPVTMYTCDGCGGQYTSPTAAWACEDDDNDMRPRD